MRTRPPAPPPTPTPPTGTPQPTVVIATQDASTVVVMPEDEFTNLNLGKVILRNPWLLSVLVDKDRITELLHLDINNDWAMGTSLAAAINDGTAEVFLPFRFHSGTPDVYGNGELQATYDKALQERGVVLAIDEDEDEENLDTEED